MGEYIDVYDGNRRRTGLTLPRQGTKLGRNQYQLFATAICQDLQGRFLITQRSPDKAFGAGWWEVSGGGALAGEDSLQAAVRETAEEVGLDVSGVQAQLLSSYCNTDRDPGDNYFNDIYLFRFDFSIDQVTVQAEEAVDCKLATWSEIESLNEQGVFLHFKRIESALRGLDGSAPTVTDRG